MTTVSTPRNENLNEPVPPDSSALAMAPMELITLDHAVWTDGTPMEVQNCDGSADQDWTITADANSGTFFLKHKPSNLCLDANGSPLQIKGCNSNNGQKYKLGSSY